MNRQEEIERIMRLIRDMADDHVLKECIGKALDLAYWDGYRQHGEDSAFSSTDQRHSEKTGE